MPTAALGAVAMLDVACIQPSPLRPRSRIDQTGLDTLALSIERHGLLQPIVVREVGPNRYELLAGERRLSAHRQLGRRGIPALVTTGSALELSLVENLQREELDALELAAGVQRLVEQRWSREDIAELVGRSRTWVGDVLVLNTLPAAIRQEYPAVRHVVPRTLLVEIARTADPQVQAALWEEAKAGALTVRAARQKRRVAEPGLPRALSAVRRCMAQLDRLDEGTVLEEGDRESLLALRARIDALLTACAPAERLLDV